MALKVHVEDKLYIEHDGNQYVLKEYTGRWYLHNEGKENEEERESYRVIGYYGTVKNALTKVLELKISQSTATNLLELILEITELSNELNKLLKGETLDE